MSQNNNGWSARKILLVLVVLFGLPLAMLCVFGQTELVKALGVFTLMFVAGGALLLLLATQVRQRYQPGAARWFVAVPAGPNILRPALSSSADAAEHIGAIPGVRCHTFGAAARSPGRRCSAKSTWFPRLYEVPLMYYVILGVALVAVIGLYFFVKNKG